MSDPSPIAVVGLGGVFPGAGDLEAFQRNILAKVDTSGDCWLWTGTVAWSGYGLFWLDGKMQSAHRVAWTLENGDVPSGVHVCHTCDVRHCVRPEHLWLGTHSDNMRDAVAKGRARHPDNRGIKCGTSELTEAEVRAIRSDPRTLKQIGAAYGIDWSHVGAIKRREKWAHLD